MIDQYPSANGVLTSLIWRKTAAGGETSLSGYDNASQALSYTPGQEQVYLNGILLVRGPDYTATNGTSITALAALAADDFVQINCYNNFSVASVPSTSITGTIANNQLANSAITINGNAVSLGGSVSLPGDIESVTAGTGLSGGGNSGAVTLTNTVATEFDAKGDLVVGTGADTFARLPVAADGSILVADSSTATGLAFAAPAGSSGPAFQAFRAFPTPGHQSISNGVTTKIGFTNEVYDTDSCFDSTTNFRFTPNKAGYYQINLTVANSSCTGRTIDIFKNGSQDVRPGAGAISGDSTLSGGFVLEFNGTTDYVEAFVYLTGSNLLAYAAISGVSFSGVWIRS